jgi:predicted RNase H-like nuclease (RuvC/YqgF family)
MKKQITLSILLFCSLSAFAQVTKEDLEKEIKPLTEKVIILQTEKSKLKSEIAALKSKVSTANKNIDSLQSQTQKNSNAVSQTATDLGTKIQQTETSTKDSISKLDKDVEKNQLYWIIATLITSMLGGLVYWLLGKRITTSQTDIESQIRNTKKSLEEESLKLDSKLVEVLETQLKLKQEEKQIVSVNSNAEIDHSLALKVADEIVRMQKNISKMDEETKGLKPLVKGIERIQANFASNGYEMVNLLNKDFDERMNIDVINFITDENLTEGRKIITSVIKPQVNYNDVLIQRAQVDVSQN